MKCFVIFSVISLSFLSTMVNAQDSSSDFVCISEYQKICPTLINEIFSSKGHQCIEENRDKLTKDCLEFANKILEFKKSKVGAIYSACKSDMEKYCSCYDQQKEYFEMNICLQDQFVNLSCACRKTIINTLRLLRKEVKEKAAAFKRK